MIRPHEAVARYVAPLRRALRCVTPAHVTVVGRRMIGADVALVVNDHQPVALRQTPLRLEVSQRCAIVPAAEGCRLTTREYIYTVAHAEHGELLGFHWHPEIEAVPGPHLHLYLAQRLGLVGLDRAHIPTPRVALEDVLGLLLGDLRVPARRTDWRAVLDETRARFVARRSWG